MACPAELVQLMAFAKVRAESVLPTLFGPQNRYAGAMRSEAIARLPERYRTVLALRELEGLPYEGIADVLALSLGTVESRLFRARKRLRALLVAEAGGDEKGGQP